MPQQTISELTSEPAISGPGLDPDDRCAGCAHPLSTHDAIEVRYCAATAASSLSRGCICGSAV